MSSLDADSEGADDLHSAGLGRGAGFAVKRRRRPASGNKIRPSVLALLGSDSPARGGRGGRASHGSSLRGGTPRRGPARIRGQPECRGAGQAWVQVRAHPPRARRIVLESGQRAGSIEPFDEAGRVHDGSGLGRPARRDALRAHCAMQQHAATMAFARELLLPRQKAGGSSPPPPWLRPGVSRGTSALVRKRS